MNELLPCPFCGRDPIPGYGHAAGQPLFIVRRRCGGGVTKFFEEAEATAAWNTRAAAQLAKGV